MLESISHMAETLEATAAKLQAMGRESYQELGG
jgi:hypothetical protein